MRIDQLTFTRFIAAMAIVVYHFGRAVPPFDHPALSPLLHHANLGVSYFYILSGFVMMVAYYKDNSTLILPAAYYKNRFARIYPMYLLALLLVVFYDGISSLNQYPVSLVLSLFGLQAWHPPSALQLNYPGWSISVELFFYALFPWLFNRFYRNYTFHQLLLGVAAIWVLSQLFFNLALHSSFYRDFPSNRANALFYFPLMHVNEFLVGNIAGLFVVKNQNRRLKYSDICILLLAAAMIVLLRADLSVNFHNGLLAVFIAPSVILFSLSRGWFAKLCTTGPLQFLGEISFGIYILQVPVYLFCYSLLTRWGIKNYTILFYLYCLGLILIAALFYRLVEVPLRTRIKNYRKPGKLLLQKA